MKRLVIAAFFAFIPVVSFSQIQIGDIKVDSLKELFNKENDSLWNEFGVFNKSDSDVWINDMPSMLMNMADEEQAIILAFRKDLNQDSVRTLLINQLNEQFGKFKEKTIPYPTDPTTYEWYKKENGIEYIFSLSKDKEVGALNIFVF